MNRLALVISLLFLLLTMCAPGMTLTPTVIVPTATPTLANTPKTEPTTGKISGKVIDSSDGSPIPFANVITDPPTSSVTTDADGNYSISDVHPGNYRVIAIKLDYTSRDVLISVTAGGITTADLHFVKGQTILPAITLTPMPTTSKDVVFKASESR